MKYVAAFGRFWWDFVVGDDWLVAVGLVVALGVTAAIAHHDVTAWWLLPVAVVALLVVSIRRTARRSD
jgi:hydrogenase/urease accessory protein HupE